MTEQPGGPDELDAAIARAAARLRERARLAARRQALDTTLAVHQREVDVLERAADHEQSQVEALEGLTLDRVLAALRGSLADDLERERAEAQAAAYRLAETRARGDVLRTELDGLLLRLDGLADVDGERERALTAKDSFLRSRADDPRAAELAEIASQRGSLDDALREVDEAVAAADAARSSLAQVTELLGSADSWSAYDTWLGGGMISSAVKHDRLDQAQRAATRAEEQLARLRRELADVGGATDVVPALGMDGVTRFFDIWFDNIVTDLSVRRRIKDAQRTSSEATTTVARVRGDLGTRRRELAEQRAELVRRRDDLLGAG